MEGLPRRRTFTALARAQEMTDFPLGLCPPETAFDYLRASVRKEGVLL